MAKIIFKRGDETFDINMPKEQELFIAHKLKLPRFQQIVEDNVSAELATCMLILHG